MPDEVGLYTTAARPDGALGGKGVRQLQVDVAAALAERGQRAEADGALGATASWCLREVHRGHGIDLIAGEAASRRFGFSGVLRSFTAFDMRNQDAWGEQLEQIPSNMPITRYGIVVSPSGRSGGVVLGSVEVEYEPIPRAFEPGQSVTLKGQVASRFTSSHVYLTKPDGTVVEKHLPGRAFEVTFILETAGKYGLETMGDGPSGPVIASNVPLYVGIEEPAAGGILGTVIDPEQAEARMLVLLNQERATAGLNPVQPDAELRELAISHSEDMADHNFFGHVSPTTGTPEDRARRSGVLVSIFGENVASAGTPEIAHAGLMNSPGHRANMLRAEFTHVGIGATNNDSGLVVTMAFGRRPSPASLPTSATQIESALLALRASKKLPVAAADPIYRAGAQAGADALADGDDPEDVGEAIEAALKREVDRRRTGRPGSCTLAIEMLELSQLNEIRPLLQPGLRRFGVGARLRRDSKGARLATVFLAEGVPCK